MPKNFGDLFRQAQELSEKFSERLAKIQEEAGKRTLEASAGGGMVNIKMNGRQEVLEVRIDPEVLRSADSQMLADLLVAAFNEALRKSRSVMAEEMKGLTGGLPIPGLI